MQGLRLATPVFALALLAACKPERDPEGADTSDTGDSGDSGSEGSEGEDPPPIPEDALRVDISGDARIATVEPEFLSYTLDTDKVVVQQLDFERPRLLALASELSPALLRIGGTKADRVYYDMSDAPLAEAPEPYAHVLDRATWDATCDFAEALGVELLFTVNAGPGPRDDQGQWLDDQARELLEYSVARDCPVRVWELGNEPGSFGLEHGLDLDGGELAADFQTFAALVDELAPAALAAGPAVAYWPVEGEVPKKILPDFLIGAGDVVDLLTWHYYPMQSSSCPIGSRRVGDPIPPLDWLDTVETWADEVEGLRDANAPGAPVWLGETGHAQCGGEPGISDTFAASFWWLDQLGRVAARGQGVSFRQALVGGAYNLIEDSALAPAPDYYASVLWKRHMGEGVLAVEVDGAPETLHVYAHCDLEGSGGVTLLAINYAEDEALQLWLGDPLLGFEASVVSAASVTATQIELNGAPFEADAGGSVPTPTIETQLGAFELPPLSYAFVRAPEFGAAACGG